jgi:precorrin-2 dehydrogenase/sirohydrochlorin ferrochelatase
MTNRSYPVMLRLQNQQCVVVGGGSVAERKTLGLLEAGACVTIISPKITEQLQTAAQAGQIIWRKKLFSRDDIHGALLVFAATNNPEVNLAVYEALQPGQLITIADRPDLSTFTVPAQLRRGRLLLTASTEGASPGLSRKLMSELAERYDESYETYVEFLAETRRMVLEKVESPKRRRYLFKRLLADEFLEGIKDHDTERLWRRFAELMQNEEEIQEGENRHDVY